MKESLKVSEVFPASPTEIYDAWLNSKSHTEMTGGEAHCTDIEGVEFTAWDGYITGKNVTLDPGREIVQSWRTAEFEPDDEDSQLVVRFADHEDGTEVTIIHTNIPEGQTQYEQGWIDNYFVPMREYFG